jgi:hypothetical protein
MTDLGSLGPLLVALALALMTVSPLRLTIARGNGDIGPDHRPH